MLSIILLKISRCLFDNDSMLNIFVWIIYSDTCISSSVFSSFLYSLISGILKSFKEYPFADEIVLMFCNAIFSPMSFR